MLDSVDTESLFFEQAGICVQCGMDGCLEVDCDVCGQTGSISDVTVFMRHYVCKNCTVEDLLNTAHITCEKCGKNAKLLDACEFRGKYACRECGFKMLRGEDSGEENIEAQSTASFLKWLGL